MQKIRHDDWDPLDASILKNQRSAYDEMRERCPVAHSEFLGWSLFRHEDIAAVLAEPGTFSNASEFLAIPNGMDPPVHGRHREALDRNFHEERMARFEPRAREIAAALLEPLLAAGEADFIDAFATPFTLKALCALLGWPEGQWECLGGWVHDSQQASFSKDPVAGKALAGLFSGHVKANLDKHRAARDHVGDATDALIATEVAGVLLDDEQIVSVLRNWTAGHGTVAAGLGILVLHLARETELQGRLRSDPSLIPAAIEEILRVDGPLVANARTTTRDVRIQDRSIPKGERLTLMWIAANRDARAFAEPDAVNLDRHTGDGMVWGQGIHLCQGMPLAKLELRVAIEELVSRTAGFELVSDKVPCRDVYPGNGLARLFLRFSV